mmetsp:Transcript_30310/g.50352  ORF Transcript_30310/g.50352 Transcript_30310/m.50352 type:complete len:109 (-) Transcript_30310:998-1324(-)
MYSITHLAFRTLYQKGAMAWNQSKMTHARPKLSSRLSLADRFRVGWADHAPNHGEGRKTSNSSLGAFCISARLRGVTPYLLFIGRAAGNNSTTSWAHAMVSSMLGPWQ